MKVEKFLLKTKPKSYIFASCLLPSGYQGHFSRFTHFLSEVLGPRGDSFLASCVPGQCLDFLSVK